jgi:hypothetical protein
MLQNPSIFRRAESIYISFSFQFFIITWHYSCDFESKINFPKSKACFAWRCLNLWSPILIDIKPSSIRRDKSIYNSFLLLSLKITWLYSCEYEYILDSDRELQRLFGITVTKLTEFFFVLVIKPEHFRRAETIYISFSFQFLIITWLYSCDYEFKIEFPNSNASFAWRCLNLWNPKLINIKPEQFSPWQVHI